MYTPVILLIILALALMEIGINLFLLSQIAVLGGSLLGTFLSEKVNQYYQGNLISPVNGFSFLTKSLASGIVI